jgi:hypothetical protein
MTLDDVYGPEHDEFQLEQEAEDWDEEALGLDWEESEERAICNEIVPPQDATLS